MKLIQQIRSNHILAISIGIIYLWFGILKFFPGVSPAEVLAKNTITTLSFELIPEKISILLLAIWETLVGLFLLLNTYRKAVIKMALIHMLFTFTPLLLFPDLAFGALPFQFTMVGQYIFKNLIIVAVLISLYRMQMNSSK